MSKSQGVNGVYVKDDSIERALKRFLRVTNIVCAEHKKATEYYEKPSQRKHAKDQENRKKKGVR